MNIFSNMKTDGLEDQGDFIPTSGPLDTDVYDAVVKLLYAGKSATSDAQNVTVHFDVNGSEVRETIYVTNKQGENFYLDKRNDNKKTILPGYSMVDQLCYMATGQGLADQTMEKKTVKIYDFKERQEVLKEVDMLTSVLGKKVKIALLNQVEDKNAKNSEGKYVPTGDTYTINVLDKVFHYDSDRTYTEVKQGMEEAKFMPQWIEKNKGKVRNKAKGAKGTAGKPGGSDDAANTSSKPKESLFG